MCPGLLGKTRIDWRKSVYLLLNKELLPLILKGLEANLLYNYLGATIAIVMRDTQLGSPASLTMSICQTCVERPRWLTAVSKLLRVRMSREMACCQMRMVVCQSVKRKEATTIVLTNGVG